MSECSAISYLSESQNVSCSGMPNLQPWVSLSNTQYWGPVACSADGTKVVAVENGEGTVYYSENSGNTWITLSNASQFPSLASSQRITMSSDGSNFSIVCFDGTVLTNIGGIGVFNSSLISPTDSTTVWRIAGSSDGNTLFAAGDGTQIFVSTNSGTDWSAIGDTRYWSGVACSSDGSKVFAVDMGYESYGSRIYLSINNGISWSYIETSSAVWKDVSCSNDGNTIALVEMNGYIHISKNGGSTWSIKGENRNWNRIRVSGDGATIFAITWDGYAYNSTDGGENWVPKGEIKYWSDLAINNSGTKAFATHADPAPVVPLYALVIVKLSYLLKKHPQEVSSTLHIASSIPRLPNNIFRFLM